MYNAYRYAGRRGFTLIELLVVVAVIALLAAILFPVFGMAREKARRSACSSNMKQIGLALLQYAQDFDETMPTMSGTQSGNCATGPECTSPGDTVWNYSTTTNQNWIKCIYPYINSWAFFHCPSAVNNTGTNHIPSGNSANSYLVNAALLQRHLSAMSAPSALIWAQESPTISRQALARPRTTGASVTLPIKSGPSGTDLNAWWYQPGGVDHLHQGGCNLLFADGHVKWRTADSVAAKEFGLSSTAVGLVDPATNSKLNPALVG